jgi:predicted amino acid dehydrogenase
MSDSGSDSDTATALAILRGIAGTSRDPDVDLAERLVAIAGATKDRVDAVLKDLVRDARRD